MLAKVITTRRFSRFRGHPFEARVSYICRKASAISLGNLAGTWPDAAWQMAVTAGLAPRLRQPAYHVVLSWSEVERPSDDDMLAAAKMVLKDLDADAYHYVLAAHRDRFNPHAHMLINRVHPISGRALSTSHDFARLERACRRVESAMGWAADRGRFDTIETNGSVQLVPKPASHWALRRDQRAAGLRPDGQAQRDRERRTGWPALRDVLPEGGLTAIAGLLDQARSWLELHLSLRRAELSYRPHGSGARICRTSGEAWMAASQLGSAYGFHAIQARLGPFEPLSGEMMDMPAIPVPIPPDARRRGLADLTALRTVFQQRRQLIDWMSVKRAAKEDLRQRHVEEAREVAEALHGLLGAVRAAFRQALARGRQQDRRDLEVGHPPPLALPFRPIDEIARLDPAEAQRRRHRHLHRHPIAGEGLSKADLAMRDHTACRQSWCRPGAAAIPMELRALAKHLQPWRREIRVDPNGILALALRDRKGGICGYLVSDLTRMRGDRLATDGRPGIGILGDAGAQNSLIVPDIITALSILASGENGAHRRVLVVPDPAATHARAHPDTLLEGGHTQIALSNPVIHSGWLQTMQERPPNAPARAAGLLPEARTFLDRTGFQVVDGKDGIGLHRAL